MGNDQRYQSETEEAVLAVSLELAAKTWKGRALRWPARAARPSYRRASAGRGAPPSRAGLDRPA